jgi:hypothetical protein
MATAGVMPTARSEKTSAAIIFFMLLTYSPS